MLHLEPRRRYKRSLPAFQIGVACSEYAGLSRFIWQLHSVKSGIPLRELRNKVFKIV